MMKGTNYRDEQHNNDQNYRLNFPMSIHNHHRMCDDLL